MVKTLGVCFGHDEKEYENLSWEDKIKSCIHSINNWNKRNLKIFGILTVIKTLFYQDLPIYLKHC